uniref:tRNA(fMet)-specific endonuclease VapC n=1 Tax=Candidatus Methanogaster sp. ANME-2c ERB4 TaxID=2759911 RepID=A0A7G9YE82_9EURY|nr:tRNA(fMet)-specific endonuclease VapC [Methanosarcinales archaeon ANME-2c ERB4]
MKSYKPMVAVDTSAIVKWFKIEENRESALKLRSWTEEGEITLVISAILPSECARGLKKAGWENKEIYEALDLLDRITNLCAIDLIPVDRLVVKSAQALVVEQNLYSADAIHAATAILTGSDFFVSSDAHHTKKSLEEYMENKGVKVLKLSEIERIEEE